MWTTAEMQRGVPPDFGIRGGYWISVLDIQGSERALHVRGSVALSVAVMTVSRRALAIGLCGSFGRCDGAVPSFTCRVSWRRSRDFRMNTVRAGLGVLGAKGGAVAFTQLKVRHS